MTLEYYPPPNPGGHMSNMTREEQRNTSRKNEEAAAAAANTSVVSDSVRPHRWQPTRLPPCLGFSRQEHWSGLPFPSPMHESEE